MDEFINNLRRDYPQLTFIEGATFCWSPKTNKIFYSLRKKDLRSAQYSALHELSHALLNHKAYANDYELLQLEVAAWEQAKRYGSDYGIDIDEEYVQDCLDSYRDWLYKRSICPNCSSKSVQIDNTTLYQCFNCHSRWRVASSKFCRPYRHHKDNKKSPATIVAGDLIDLGLKVN